VNVGARVREAERNGKKYDLFCFQAKKYL
jgi:hypothetical protein